MNTLQFPQNSPHENAKMLFLRDPVLYYTFLHLLSPKAQVIVEGEGVLMRFPAEEGNFICLAAPGKQALFPLLAHILPEDAEVYALHAFASEVLLRVRPIKRRMLCSQLYLPAGVPLTCEDNEIIDLNPSYAEEILATYTLAHFYTLAHMRETLAKAPAVGIIKEGKLAGYTFMHGEGTMGGLEVLPKWRRQGMAKRLAQALACRVRARGLTPVVQIVEGNKPSLALAGQMGFLPAGEVEWLAF